MKLELKDAAVSIGGKPIVRGVSFSANPGEFTALVGPNGSGKSTLLRACVRLNPHVKGEILWDGIPVAAWKPRAFARRVAYVAQFSPLAFDMSVRDVILMGRTPHLGLLEQEGSADHEVVDDLIERLDLARFANRSILEVSGGERQRVMIARALAQQPEVLVLDEPTNHLDITHQLRTLEFIADQGLTIIAALHDLEMAANFAQQLLVLESGELRAQGSPSSVLSSELISDVYRVSAQVSFEGAVRVHLAYPNRARSAS